MNYDYVYIKQSTTVCLSYMNGIDPHMRLDGMRRLRRCPRLRTRRL
jgi:hypothetical protein